MTARAGSEGGGLPLSARDRLAFALDVPDLGEARRWISRLAPDVGVFKIGLELFVAAGPDAVRAVRDAGAHAFLDLKLHDIPETVRRAVRAACGLGARYLTVHASGGPAMLRAAHEIARETETCVLAITVLTALEAADLAAVGLLGTPLEATERLAALAYAEGVRGLVCSPREVSVLRRAHPDAVLVTPGIRGAGQPEGDQRRTSGARDAIAAGADLLVVGRPIRDSADPVAAARALLHEIAAVRA